MDCAFKKDEFTRIPAVGQWLSTSDVRDVVSRVSQTFPIQLIFGPIVDKCAIYIWVQFTAVQLVFNPFSQLVPKLELYSQLQLSLWSDPIAFGILN